MTKQDDEEKQNVRMMWMATGAIVLFIVGWSQHAWHARKSKRDCADRHEQPVTNVADKLTDRLG